MPAGYPFEAVFRRHLVLTVSTFDTTARTSVIKINHLARFCLAYSLPLQQTRTIACQFSLLCVLRSYCLWQ